MVVGLQSRWDHGDVAGMAPVMSVVMEGCRLFRKGRVGRQEGGVCCVREQLKCMEMYLENG